MRFWLIPFSKNYKYISPKEEDIAKGLHSKKSDIYKFSRGYLRFCLSEVFSLSCQDIPISSLPGKPPLLPLEYGYVSMSHSKDTLLIGWSNKKIGVDLENISRIFNLERLLKSKWFKDDYDRLKGIKGEHLKMEILKIWVLKEALVKSHFGSIIKDYDNWQIKNNNIAFNKKFNIYRNLVHKKIKNYTIGIASEEEVENKNISFKIL